MSQSSPLLGLPYLDAAQAQKHVTHNEALRMLDAVVQLGVQSRDLAEPPAAPEAAARYIVAGGASGAWAGRAAQVAAWQDDAWAFFTPAPGWLAWVSDEGLLVAWNGAAWVTAGGGLEGGTGGAGGAAGSMSLFGVNTTADTINRLAVKSDAVLLSHDDVTPGSGDMRFKFNKAATGNTASLIYQTDYSGRAEIGLAGDDKLHVKMSSDGSAWTEAITIATNGRVGLGTDAPSATLHIVTSGSPIIERVGDNIGGGGIYMRRARGSVSEKAALQQGDVLLSNNSAGYDGTKYVLCSNFRASVDGPVSTSIVPSKIDFLTMSVTGDIFPRMEIRSDGTMQPSADNAYKLGAAGYRWASVWAANGTIQTSDARDKNVVGGLGFAGALIDTVDPVLFRWKVGGNDVCKSKTRTGVDEDGHAVPQMEIAPRPGVRTHAGFLAQDLKAAMDAAGTDFGAWGLEDKGDPDSKQWTRPDQLIAVLWAALKETRAEVAALRAQIG